MTSPSHSLSRRGELASKTSLRKDFDLYFKAVDNIYTRQNPSGAFPLNVAENKLSWPILKSKIENLSSNPIPDWVANYTSSNGSPSFRKSVAAFLSQFLTHCPIHEDNLAISSGATSVIDLTSWILGEPGDVVVFHAPSYPVYKKDIGNKAGLERYDLINHHHIDSISNRPVLTLEDLEGAFKKIESQNKRFRILVLTSPDNPTGRIFSQAEFNEIADWCIAHRIHLIVNEIYGLSLIDTSHPELKQDYPSKKDFFSFANIMQEKKSEYLHHWYALSKDFGASGFRVGLVYSLNTSFLEAYMNLNATSMVSNHTQWIFEMVLSDHDFVSAYIKSNQQKLTTSYLTVIRALRALQIPYVPAFGSLFIWVDLSEFLSEESQEAENNFWEKLFEETGILLTPGEGFGHSKRGLFRLVYSCFTPEDLEVAMNRLESFVASNR